MLLLVSKSRNQFPSSSCTKTSFPLFGGAYAKDSARSVNILPSRAASLFALPKDWRDTFISKSWFPSSKRWFASTKREPIPRRRKRADRVTPPIADRRDTELVLHGDKRADPYYYMRNKNDNIVLDYLDAENDYTDYVMKPTEPLQTKLYNEILSHIEETDSEVPTRYKGYLYYSRYQKGKEYELYCRKKDTPDGNEEILLDINEIAGDASFFDVGLLEVSPDQNILAYGVDKTGEEKYELYFKDLRTGKLFPERIANVSWCPHEGGVVWANDSLHVFYVTLDATGRPHSLWRHRLGAAVSDDTHAYHESDATFRIGLEKSKTEKYILLFAGSGITSEIHYLDADEPEEEFEVIHRREIGLEYSVEHHGKHFYILHNDLGAFNFKISKVECKDPRKENWKEVLPHRPDVQITGMDLFSEHLVTLERKNGLPQIRVASVLKRDVDGESSGPKSGNIAEEGYYVPFNEAVYSLSAARNFEFESKTFRFDYESFVTPPSVYDLEMSTGTLIPRKLTVVKDHDKSKYKVERISAISEDGEEVPISLVCKTPKGNTLKPKPCVLTAYGAYGLSNDADFDECRLPLLERGFVYAIAHVRGGGELGHRWKENGKMFHKKKTFTDFIAAAQHLIAKGYTDSSKLAITGNSAGGLLMGAAVTIAPQLFRAAVLHVPFVDIITTMMDASIPLTTIEWDEWGNPLSDQQMYHYMKSYSPYDNVRDQSYPAMLVFSGLNDPRVAYWEPTKWVAKLRATRRPEHSSNVLLLRTQMGTGHNGPSGRYSELKEEAFELAFLLTQLGVKEKEL